MVSFCQVFESIGLNFNSCIYSLYSFRYTHSLTDSIITIISPSFSISRGVHKVMQTYSIAFSFIISIIIVSPSNENGADISAISIAVSISYKQIITANGADACKSFGSIRNSDVTLYIYMVKLESNCHKMPLKRAYKWILDGTVDSELEYQYGQCVTITYSIMKWNSLQTFGMTQYTAMLAHTHTRRPYTSTTISIFFLLLYFRFWWHNHFVRTFFVTDFMAFDCL